MNSRRVGLKVLTADDFIHNLTEPTLSLTKHTWVFYRSPAPGVVWGMACGERSDSPDPDKGRAVLDKTKGFLNRNRDWGSDGLRVFPNDDS